MIEDSARYVGKPLLALLELYVLDAIEMLPEDDRKLAELMVDKTWPGSGEWQTRLESQLRFSPDLRPYLKKLWAKQLFNRTDPPNPRDFAKHVVDINFAKHIPPLE